MAVDIQILDRKFYYQLKNGDDFDQNTDDYTTYLAGNVGEKCKMYTKISASWYSILESTELTLTNEGSGIYSFESDDATFISDGFRIGDVWYTFDNGSLGSGSYRGTITYLTETKIFYEPLGGTLNTGTFSDANFQLYGNNNLTSLIFSFGLIENAEQFNVVSKVDNTEQYFYIENLGEGVYESATRDTTQQEGEVKSAITGWLTGDIFANYLDSDATDGFQVAQIFEVEMTFTILPYYLDGSLNDIKDVTDVVAPDYLENNSSLRMAFRTEFRTFLINPNTSKTGIDDNTDITSGSVGFFNERLNGFPSEYTFDSLSYYDVDDGVSVDSLVIGHTTTVSLSIYSNTDSFETDTPLVVMHSWLPEEDEYTNQINNYNDTWLFDTCRAETGGSSDSDIITNFNPTYVDSGQIDITFDIAMSSGQIAKLEDEDYYLLSMLVADDTLSGDSTDKVQLLFDVRQYFLDTDEYGLAEIVTMEHTVPDEEDYTSCILVNEDSCIMKARTSIDMSLGAIIDSVSLKVVAYDSNTNEYFEISSYNVPFNATTISDDNAVNGIQAIDFTGSRGFTVSGTTDFDIVTVKSDTNDGTNQFYDWEIAYKIPWRTTVAIDADDIFYDSDEPLNNLNQKASNYSGLNNYEIRIFLQKIMKSSEDGVTTEYNLSSPDFTISDYEIAL